MMGCATTSPTPKFAKAEVGTTLPSDLRTVPMGDIYQFDPIPVAEIGAQDLKPVAVKNVSELLESAQRAFQAANEAQERGDKEAAYTQYSLMMELLLESDLDPTVFYNLRSEFGSILTSSTKMAKTYERIRPKEWSSEVVEMAFKSELDYPNPLNDRVLAEIRYIQTAYPKGFQYGLDRSSKYLPFIREEFRKAGLPEDLVWLAMVESQFTPRINSHAGAGGMWQFMKSTGRRYGLKSDQYVDDRYDWRKSTKASIQYMTELYDMFDRNWPLAVSGYNMGEAGVERAIARSGGERDLWKLMDSPRARIPRETKKFYPKLLASAIIANNPEKYGFTLNIQPEEIVDTMEVSGAYLIRDIERSLSLPAKTIQQLNPHLLYGYTPPNGTSTLYIPKGYRTQVAKAVSAMPQLRPDTHVVRRGETISGIAGLYKVSSRDLLQTNNIRSPRSLQIGQRLVVPGQVSSGNTGTALASVEGRSVYTVRNGDSLSRIASRNRVTVRQLQQWNSLGSKTRIHVGDRLYVAAVPKPASTPRSQQTATVASAPSGPLTIYTVRNGDYPEKIANTHGVKLNNLLAWNDLTMRSTIRVGDKLKMYNAQSTKKATLVKASPSTSSTATTHTVRRGENPSTIAKKYRIRTRDLLKWNGLTSKSIVHIGDKLYVSSSAGKQSKLTVAAATETKSTVHVVRSGENPSTIAKKYRVNLKDLYTWNGWSSDPVLQIGDQIQLRTD
ncbi:MAG: hypothetical protein COA73_04580 [Candidatus Hydrogenedentota bacterium]|nr:MAG: hypothetical protein COA73_04580 [Candidatus Hydrogenedentota bacterium]